MFVSSFFLFASLLPPLSAFRRECLIRGSDVRIDGYFRFLNLFYCEVIKSNSTKRALFCTGCTPRCKHCSSRLPYTLVLRQGHVGSRSVKIELEYCAAGVLYWFVEAHESNIFAHVLIIEVVAREVVHDSLYLTVSDDHQFDIAIRLMLFIAADGVVGCCTDDIERCYVESQVLCYAVHFVPAGYAVGLILEEVDGGAVDSLGSILLRVLHAHLDLVGDEAVVDNLSPDEVVVGLVAFGISDELGVVGAEQQVDGRDADPFT